MSAEYNAWERSKKFPTKHTMNKLFEKVLNESSAREPEETEAFAVAQDVFESWD